MFSLQPPASRKRNRANSEDDVSLQTFHQQRRISKNRTILLYASAAVDSISPYKRNVSSPVSEPPTFERPKPDGSDAAPTPKADTTPKQVQSNTEKTYTAGYGYYDVESSLHDDNDETAQIDTDDSMTGMGMEMDVDDGPILSPCTSFTSTFPSLSKISKNKSYISWCDSPTPPLSSSHSANRAQSPASDNDSGVDCKTRHASPNTELNGVSGVGGAIDIRTAAIVVSIPSGPSKYLAASGTPSSAPASLQDQAGKWSMGGTKNWGHVTGSVAGGGHGRVRLGYRADCMDCLKRKPGHFMHFT